MGKEKLVLVISLTLGLAAAGIVYFYMNTLKRNEHGAARRPAASQAAPRKTVPCLVAARNIPPNTRINAGMVKTVNLPESAAHPKALKDANKAVGRFTRDRLFKGQIILAPNLGDEKETEPSSPKDTAENLSATVPPGLRAITVNANVTAGVGNMLKPGDLVDIITFFDNRVAEKPVAVTLLRRVTVLAIDKDFHVKDTRHSVVKLASASMREHVDYKSVTLAVRPNDSLKLTLAESVGALRLVLHGTGPASADGAMNKIVITGQLAREFGFEIKKEDSAAVSTGTTAPASAPPAPAAPALIKPDPNAIQIMRGSVLSIVSSATATAALQNEMK